MSRTVKRIWQALKIALALAIVVGVGLQFRRILVNIDLSQHPIPFKPEYLIPAGLLYLAAHTLWGCFWVRLLRNQGVHVGWALGLRAYFVSQFGKYLPGKALVIVMRVEMMRSVGARRLPVAITATYETLTSMAAGSLLGVLLLPWLGVLPEIISRNLAFVGLIAGLPIGLALINRVAAQRIARTRGPSGELRPSPSLVLLAQGLLQAAVGWLFLGLSLSLIVRAVSAEPIGWQADDVLGDIAAVGIAYVAGFVILVSPGGLGVRELILEMLLTPRFAHLSPDSASARVVITALMLRLVWTAFEVALALALYCWKPASPDRTPTTTEMLDV